MRHTVPLALLLYAIAALPAQAEATPPWRIVNYWSEWCAPCRKEVPVLNALSRQLASLGVSVVGVNFDDDPHSVTLEKAQRLGIEFPTLTAEEAAALSLRYPDAMPTTFILNPRNEVVARLVGLQTHDSIMVSLDRLRALDSPQ